MFRTMSRMMSRMMFMFKLILSMTSPLRSVFTAILLVVALPGQHALAQTEALTQRLLNASTYTIAADEELLAYMNVTAERTLNEHCVVCHEADLQGRVGVPNLVDYDWLWGITGFEMSSTEAVMAIMQTILYGVRNTDCDESIKRYGACPDTHFSQMPAYGDTLFTDQQINDLTEYVLELSGAPADAAAVARVSELGEVCTECHGDEGYGYQMYGGPNLRDDIWLFGNQREQIYDVIYNGRTEACPAWGEGLEPVSVKAVAVYLYNKSNGY